MTTKQIAQAVMFAALVAAAQVTGAAGQTVWMVTSNADSGPGSLRDTVAGATPGDTIRFDMTQVVSPIALSSGQIVLDQDVNIEGPGAGVLALRNTSAPNSASRVLLVQPGVTAAISGLTLTGGNVLDPERGGGISNSGTLTLSFANISGNAAGNLGGGIANLGGTLTVSHSTISNNSAAAGGGLSTLQNGNTLPTTIVTHSTIAANSTPSDGGGIGHFRGLLTVVDTTISGNSAGAGGGIAAFAPTTLLHTTVSNNSAQVAGGLLVRSTTTVRNTILANHQGFTGDCQNFGGTLNVEFSLIGTGLWCVNGTNVSNLAGDPLLGPLQDNGGPTLTHALLTGSPAIDTGSDALALNAGVTTDQRGLARFTGAAVDLGAFEWGHCLAGSYYDGTACVPASPGFFVATDGAQAQTACSPGTFQPLAGQTSCLQAAPGFYVNAAAAVAATACDVGKYQPNSGSVSCLSASPGYYVADTASETQAACDLGRYQPAASQANCLLADPGFYVPTIAAVAQVACPVGTTSAAGASACTPIAPVFPASSVLDTFNRANGAAGASWTFGATTLTYRIAGNRLDVQLGGPIVWAPATFGTSQEAFVTLAAVDPRSPSQGVLLKVQTGSVPNAGAISVVYDAIARRVRVSTLRTSVPVWQPYASIAATFVHGDQLGARALPNGTVEVYKNGTRVGTVTLSSSDQAFFNSKGGRIGLWTLAAPGAFFDAFGGGTVLP